MNVQHSDTQTSDRQTPKREREREYSTQEGNWQEKYTRQETSGSLVESLLCQVKELGFILWEIPSKNFRWNITYQDFILQHDFDGMVEKGL